MSEEAMKRLMLAKKLKQRSLLHVITSLVRFIASMIPVPALQIHSKNSNISGRILFSG
jgi:hypothetical protein